MQKTMPCKSVRVTNTAVILPKQMGVRKAGFWPIQGELNVVCVC
jgi:hypothetical protein